MVEKTSCIRSRMVPGEFGAYRLPQEFESTVGLSTGYELLIRNASGRFVIADHPDFSLEEDFVEAPECSTSIDSNTD
jgi:hypothetical protein